MAEQIPGFEAGTWTIDPVHSEVGFSVRHMMVSKVKGTFREFEGTIVTTDDPTQTKVNATVQIASIDTGNEQRDGHLRTNDFFDAPTYPTMTFTSTSVSIDGGMKITGDLTIHGVTKPVTFDIDFGGTGKDATGADRIGATATTKIKRSDFGVSWNAALETGGFAVSDEVQITVDVSAVRQ